MRSIEQIRAAVVQHGSPTRGWRRNAETEKAHGGFGQDRSSHADRGLHNDRLNNVRQNVANDDSKIARSQRTRGLHEFSFAGSENLSADKARITDPSSERQREHEIENTGTAEGDERDREQNPWEGQKRIHQNDIDEAVDRSSVISGDGADHKSQKERGQHNATTDQHRDARAVNGAREHV